jgi:hypothetical protein
MSQLVEFYRGNATDARGRMLARIWEYNDTEMEYHHDFIQWMFPLQEPSRYNPDAPVLTENDIKAFHVEPALQENLLRSLERFLSFLGLVRHQGHIAPGPDYTLRQSKLTTPNHNWLRITRVITSLRLLGQETESREFLACLQEMVRQREARISEDTMNFWLNAAFPDRQKPDLPGNA